MSAAGFASAGLASAGFASAGLSSAGLSDVLAGSAPGFLASPFGACFGFGRCAAGAGDPAAFK
ncbi:MAG: hypothetical protein JO254_00535 [Pseudolabrys sp.]|nr:hypothetical protein [Pseudolabrys sp.]